MWNVANFMTEDFFREMLLNRHLGAFVFFSDRLPEKGTQFFSGGCDLHRSCGMVVTLLSFLYNYHNLTLKSHQRKRSYADGFLLADSKLKVYEE